MGVSQLMGLFKRTKLAGQPVVTCRKRDVAIFEMGNRVNLKHIINKAKRHGAPEATIFYHENAIEIKYFETPDSQGLDSDVIMTEMFPYNSQNESIFIKLKKAGLNKRFIEQRQQHGDYSNVRELKPEAAKSVPFVDHQARRLEEAQRLALASRLEAQRLPQAGSQIKRMDGDFGKRAAEGWEQQQKKVGVKQ